MKPHEWILGVIIVYGQAIINRITGHVETERVYKKPLTQQARRKIDYWDTLPVEVISIEVNEQRTTNGPEFWSALANREVSR